VLTHWSSFLCQFSRILVALCLVASASAFMPATSRAMPSVAVSANVVSCIRVLALCAVVFISSAERSWPTFLFRPLSVNFKLFSFEHMKPSFDLFFLQFFFVQNGAAAASAAAALLVAGPAFAGDADAGGLIFSANCAACHAGGNNVIQAEKTLKKDALVEYLAGGFKEESIVYQVTNGKNAMPAFGGRLSDEEIGDVASYVYKTASTDAWE